jgi:hypothetical protein
MEQAWHQRVDRRLTLSAGGVCGAVGAGEISQMWHLHSTFYITVAQILPIMLLVGVVEGRYYRRLWVRTAFDRYLLMCVLLVPLAGEAAALACLGLGHDATVLRGLVLFGLGLSAMTVIVYAFHGPQRQLMGVTTELLEAADHVRRLSRSDREV